jgi:glutamate dehydrogenase
VEDLLAEQAALTRAVMAFTRDVGAGEDARSAASAVSSWATLHADVARGARRSVEEIEAAGGPWTFAKLTIANAALRELVAQGQAGK